MFLHGAFATKNGEVSPAVNTMAHINAALWVPPAILTALTIALGVAPGPLSRAITAHLDATFGPSTAHAHDYLAAWHGFGVPLALSTVILVGGAILFWQRKVLRMVSLELPALGSADAAYDAVLVFLRNLSLRLTASTQRGSLIINLGVIFVVLTVLPMVVLIAGQRNDVRMELWTTPWQALICVIIVIMAVGATRTNNRLSGVIMVGVTGYGLGMIFALHGAPDLMLTQVLVETIVMVIFMLVLRKLPTQTEWTGTPRGNRARAWLAIAVGVSVTVVTLFAINARTRPTIAEHIPDLAYDIGHGRNAVNVLLVDLRAWDTLGEISVLVIAATGVASLIYGTRSFARESHRPTLTALGRRWLSAGADTEKAQNRSLMVDVVTRMTFPTMMAVSAYFFFAGHNAPGGGFCRRPGRRAGHGAALLGGWAPGAGGGLPHRRRPHPGRGPARLRVRGGVAHVLRTAAVDFAGVGAGGSAHRRGARALGIAFRRRRLPHRHRAHPPHPGLPGRADRFRRGAATPAGPGSGPLHGAGGGTAASRSETIPVPHTARKGGLTW